MNDATLTLAFPFRHWDGGYLQKGRLGEPRQDRLAELARRLAQNAERRIRGSLFELVEPLLTCVDGHTPGILLRVAEYARRYQREGDALAAALDGERDCPRVVAARENPLLSAAVTMPYGPHCIDDVAGLLAIGCHLESEHIVLRIANDIGFRERAASHIVATFRDFAIQ